MSELTDRLNRMLTQAQIFVRDAPLEAQSRALLAVQTAETALPGLAGAERDAVVELHAVAQKRAARYAATFATWSQGVRDRAEMFGDHERKCLDLPLPPKL